MTNETETERKQSRLGWIVGGFVLAVMIIVIITPAFKRARTNSHKAFCINQLMQIESGKDQMAMDVGLTNGWAAWDGVDGYNPATDDIAAFSNLVDGTYRYTMFYPLCPDSTTEVENAAQSAHDYQVNPIGSNAVCKIRGGMGPDDHALSK